MLRADGVSVYYRDQPVFDELTLSIENPGAYLFLGANSSGKTTLLKLLSGRLKPKKGQVYVKGVKLYTLFGENIPRIEFVPETFTIQLDESIKQIYEIRKRYAETGRSFKEFCEFFDLPKDYRSLCVLRPSELSRSELCEVEIAMVIATNPDIVFIDDCFSAFSTKTIERVIGNLELFLSEGEKAVCIATSRFFGYMDFFTDVYLIKDGNIQNLRNISKASAEQAHGDRKKPSGETKPERGRFLIIRCGEYFYRHERITTENEYFVLHAVLENALVVELKGSIDNALNYLEENGIDISGLDFKVSVPDVEKKIADSL